MVETRIVFEFTGNMKDILAGAMFREQMQFMRKKYKKMVDKGDVTVELEYDDINLVTITIKPNRLGLDAIKEMKGIPARAARAMFKLNGTRLKVFRGNTLVKI